MPLELGCDDVGQGTSPSRAPLHSCVGPND